MAIVRFIRVEGGKVERSMVDNRAGSKRSRPLSPGTGFMPKGHGRAIVPCTGSRVNVGIGDPTE
jgi:hypothetical protein